jgi:hypothetical protein
MTTLALDSSGLGERTLEVPATASSTSESENWFPFFFHNGSEYDFVRTRGSFVRWAASGIKTHSLSKRTTRPIEPSIGSGEDMPGNIKDPIIEFASKIVVVVVAIEEGWKFKLNLVEKKKEGKEMVR